MKFNDVSPAFFRKKSLVPEERIREILDSGITKLDIENVWQFVEERREAGEDYFVVHCDAGVSRSPAVAAAISLALTENVGNFFEDFVPNLYVFGKMMEYFPYARTLKARERLKMSPVVKEIRFT